ncbi:Beta-glucosidase 12 [Platanthera guangdongensis]|uniref:Beta-glucosidase 12 n=1 Tax=Platanthera guangdongensis TaxID=2320717 RepID=A0ABR2LVR0_9ASPA
MAMAFASASTNVQARSCVHGSNAAAFSSRLMRGQKVVLLPWPHVRRRRAVFGSAVCSKQAAGNNGDDLAPGEDLEISSRLGRISFPSRFLFGAATSAFQVEGTSFGGRGECIWNTFCRKYPEKIEDRSNGDIAADSYHRYKDDVDLIADIGMDAYRFSISWPRILPRIEPFATLFHWDVPQALEDEYGGFLDKRIVEDFKNYAKICYEEFGDKVKHWITMNEPWTFSTLGYGQGVHAPGRCTKGLPNLNCPAGGDSLREPYIAAHNILLAHAEAARLYIDEYQVKQQGKVGITLVSHWYEPYDNNPIEKEAQQRALEFNLGWFMDPLEYGKYPFSMRSLVQDRLPVFTPEESEKLKGVLEVDNDLPLAEAIVDTHRTEYLTLHLHELTEALRREANVKGYFTWSLLDNFEWQAGYKSRLGLHYIDYRDKTVQESGDEEPVLPDRTRTKKNSSIWFKRFLNIKRKAGMTFGPKF